MTSSYSADLKLELMVTGENAGTWGDNTNNNLNLIQQAIAGVETVTLSSGGTLALAMTDKTISNARNMVIKFATASIAASTICTIPDSIEKFYIFDATGLTNPTNLTIKTASGSGFTLDQAKIYAAYSDGTNLKEISLDTLGGSIGTAGIADDAVTNAKIADDAVRAAQISNNAVVTAGILNANVTTDKIADANVTTAKIADDAVTADKLANTAVTAASYTLASITVDAQGRLTAASSGTAGGGSFEFFTASYGGPTSGTYTANPNATKAQIYLCGGGGGGGGGSNAPNSQPAQPGGIGGTGFAEISVTGGDAYPFNVGSQGDGGPGSNGIGSPGNAGGATAISNVTANGANGGRAKGRGGGAGNPGNLSGADIDMNGMRSGFTVENRQEAPIIGFSGSKGNGNNSQAVSGNQGSAGVLIIFENTGT